MDVQAQRNLHILMVEDNEFDQLLEERELRKSGLIFDLVCVDNAKDFLDRLKSWEVDVILCDYSLPKFNALEALQIVKDNAPKVPVIIVTGKLTDEMAVECLKKGALDYVIKEKIIRLRPAIDRALELRRSNTEREEAEKRLKRSEKQLRIITGVLPAILCYLTKDFHIFFCNKIYERWFRSGKDIIGQSAESAFGKEISGRMIAEKEKLMTGQEVSFESALSGDGNKKFLKITLTPDQEDNEIKGFVCLMTDISETKIYEEDLKLAKEQADAANEAKSQFLANMSHEMRTPLSAMLGFAELLMTHDHSAADRMAWVKKISMNCEHLKKMIDEILDLSKVEAGKLQVYKTLFSVPELLSQVQSTLFPLAKAKNLELRFEIEDKIPERIFSDPVKLRHIFINIIGNAIKFSEKSPIVVSMKMNTEGMVQFDVKDKGPGLTPEQSQHLFQPFMQADSSMTRRAGGTGLGLALARRYAQALGGDVHLAESVLGQGSIFSIAIEPGLKPDHWVTSLQLIPVEKTETRAAPVESSTDLHSLKILVVDDAPDNQFLIRRFLEKAGAQVDVASDGHEGVEKALRESYDLILMDIQMPVQDGYHATSELRQKGYQKPILALTAHALKEERERCLKAGFSDFLTKPIKRLELLEQVAKFKEVDRPA